MYEKSIIDDFLFESERLQNKLSEIKEVSRKIKEAGCDRFFDYISSLPKIEREPRKWKTYIFKDISTNIYKIGRSENVNERMRSLSNSSGRTLVSLFLFNGDIEKDLHSIFSKYRVKGEWFEIPCEEFRGIFNAIKEKLQPSLFNS